jgi:RNA polymerase-binding transcription factor DksA
MDERILELAEALANSLVENNVDRIRAQIRTRDPKFDGLCEDCGEDIPEARLDTGATTCIECAVIQERRRAQYKR